MGKRVWTFEELIELNYTDNEVLYLISYVEKFEWFMERRQKLRERRARLLRDIEETNDE